MTGYAQRVQWSPHRLDMSRAMFGVSLTPLHDLVAPTLERLPADIGAQLRREFWKRHGKSPDWEKKHSAQDWLAAEVAEFEGEKIHRAFDEHEIRALAARWSDLCLRMQRLEVMQDFARSVGVEPPEVKRNVTRVGAARRLSCPRWWRRQIRKTYLRKAEAHLRARGFVHKKRQVYASDRAVEHRQQRKARDRSMLQEMQVVSDAGDQLELWDVVQKSQANPALRRGELMLRLRGFEGVAHAAGHRCRFYTLTCPSAFHRTHSNGTANDRWRGFTPRQGQQWLSKMWARARAKLHRLSVFFYGFRVAEPHHDGTPHWHVLLFGSHAAMKQATRVLHIVWSAEYRDELQTKAARKARFHVKAVFRIQRADGTYATAAGYLAKYVAKNIDGHEVGDDYETDGKKASESCDRVGAWASAHGIRQFQQIGGPPVTVWRELRRLREAGVHPAIRSAHAAADAGEWAEFIAALGGIERGRNGSVKLWTEVTGELNQYDELRGQQIAGVQALNTSEGAVSVVKATRTVATEGIRADGPAAPYVRLSGEGDPSPLGLIRIRTREKIWRIQRKAEGQRAGHESRLDAGVADATGTGTAKRPALLPSLGPVSITVRGSKTMPGESSTGARGSGSIRGPTWTH